VKIGIPLGSAKTCPVRALEKGYRDVDYAELSHKESQTFDDALDFVRQAGIPIDDYKLAYFEADEGLGSLSARLLLNAELF
jgi:hypothetical protein